MNFGLSYLLSHKIKSETLSYLPALTDLRNLLSIDSLLISRFIDVLTIVIKHQRFTGSSNNQVIKNLNFFGTN
ncbi:hypothetical protein BpHYR1_032699 [Brachionus plicatilis]|uniref:Uncharacterized protein n=1 Tax=Brachionus plicatilis TaxID=10195 RepID=A0A3M7Q3F8_BRAPC|nr:hypothetical protein BpHYR1_032699 [Brachionus plicatilis]